MEPGRTVAITGWRGGQKMMGRAETKQAAPWPVWRLAVLLYVFAAGAVAINLFMLGLLVQALGFAALPPITALIAALPLGLPAAWAAGLWVRHLLDEATEKADADGRHRHLWSDEKDQER